MNNLTWFIYAAEVLPKLGLLFILSAAVVVVLYLVKGFLYEGTIERTKPYTGYHMDDDDRREVAEWKESISAIPVPWLKYKVPLVCVILLVSAPFFIPSKETMYLMAGSEIGEMAVSSEEGQEIMDDIHAVIRHQLSILKGE